MNLATINRWIRRRILRQPCRHRHLPRLVDQNVRAKSHELSNLAAVSGAYARFAQKEREAIDEFARAIRR
jgi:hypothetical protein